MKRKVVLLAAMLLPVTVAVAAGEETGAGKPATGHSEGKTGAPAGEHKLDFKELFGCEPMGEEGHKPKPASGTSPQGTVQSMPERDSTQEKR